LSDFQLDGELYFAPGFPTPPNCDYKGYQSYIDSFLPQESPHLYGLHPNAEIDFLTTTSDNLFRTVLEMQPRDSGSGIGLGVSREDKVCCVCHCVSLSLSFNNVLLDFYILTLVFHLCYHCHILTLLSQFSTTFS